MVNVLKNHLIRGSPSKARSRHINGRERKLGIVNSCTAFILQLNRGVQFPQPSGRLWSWAISALFIKWVTTKVSGWAVKFPSDNRELKRYQQHYVSLSTLWLMLQNLLTPGCRPVELLLLAFLSGGFLFFLACKGRPTLQARGVLFPCSCTHPC